MAKTVPSMTDLIVGEIDEMLDGGELVGGEVLVTEAPRRKFMKRVKLHILEQEARLQGLRAELQKRAQADAEVIPCP